MTVEEKEHSCKECASGIDCAEAYPAGTMVLCKITSTTCKKTMEIGKCNPVTNGFVFCVLNMNSVDPNRALSCEDYFSSPNHKTIKERALNAIKKIQSPPYCPDCGCLMIQKHGVDWYCQTCDIGWFFLKPSPGEIKIPIVPMNAGYLYPRRECENVDEKLNCKLAPNDASCSYSELTENECDGFIQKKRPIMDVKLYSMVGDDNYDHYVITSENGIAEHFKGIYTCFICEKLFPMKPEDRCKNCPWPHDPEAFVCRGGSCDNNDKEFLTINNQPIQGWPFCTHACPAKNKKETLRMPGPKKSKKEKIEKTKKSRVEKKESKKPHGPVSEQKSLF